TARHAFAFPLRLGSIPALLVRRYSEGTGPFDPSRAQRPRFRPGDSGLSLDTRRSARIPGSCRERAIRIRAGAVSAEALLNDSKTARVIWDALPIEAKGSTWGDEIYLDIGVTAAPEAARRGVDLGDLAYVAPGTAS